MNEDPYKQGNLQHNSIFAAERQRLQACLKSWIHETGDSFSAS
ncbi:MAG: hypothetical protein AAF902_15800 [Chloroflexota bacterium]